MYMTPLLHIFVSSVSNVSSLVFSFQYNDRLAQPIKRSYFLWIDKEPVIETQHDLLMLIRRTMPYDFLIIGEIPLKKII